MNDFLRNLRSPHKKETPPQQKTVDSRFYNQPDRRIINDRRSTPSPSVDPVLKQLTNALPQLIDSACIISEQMERMATINERIAESEIRKNNAITDFFEGIGKMMEDGGMPSGFEKHPRATASYASGTHYTKDDILSIINEMREQGATFAIIADYLREKGIPTFSGRGEWHAQTIHRLCK